MVVAVWSALSTVQLALVRPPPTLITAPVPRAMVLMRRSLMSSSLDEGNDLCSVQIITADGMRTMVGVRRGELLRTALLRKGATPHNEWSRMVNCRGIGTW
jgi:hypothetical protein